MVDLRKWAIIARPGDGKTSFAMQMRPKFLVIDADGRWSETNMDAQSVVVHEKKPLDIDAQMTAMIGVQKGIGTVIVDSGTSLLDYEIAKGMLKVQERGDKTNDKANYQKAMTMRLLSGMVAKWDCDSLWVFHLMDTMQGGRSNVRSTISKIELDRLKMYLNVILGIENRNGKRGIVIQWCRWNPDTEGSVIWDVNGHWKGVPDMVDQFLSGYDKSMGYNGKAYTPQTILEFVVSKGAKFTSVEQMAKDLAITEWPAWYDRNAWGKIITASGVSV